MPQTEVFCCYLVRYLVQTRVQPFQTLCLVYGWITVWSIELDWLTGSRECTLFSKNRARIGQVPQKQVFRCYLPRQCFQTGAGRIQSISVLPGWIGVRSIELNLQHGSRDCAYTVENGARIRHLGCKSSIWLIFCQFNGPARGCSNRIARPGILLDCSVVY